MNEFIKYMRVVPKSPVVCEFNISLELYSGISPAGLPTALGDGQENICLWARAAEDC